MCGLLKNRKQVREERPVLREAGKRALGWTSSSGASVDASQIQEIYDDTQGRTMHDLG